MSAAILWFLAGLVLVLAEFVTPGFVLVFLGLGAWLASLAAWTGWAGTVGAQFLVFAVASLLLLLGLRRFCRGWFLGASQDAAIAGSVEEFMGAEVRVLSRIAPGHRGKVEFKGVPWSAQSETSLEAGDTAVIAAVDGLCLKVTPR